MEKIAMVHEGLPDTKENPRIESKEAFEKVWKSKGWKLASKAEQPLSEKKEK